MFLLEERSRKKPVGRGIIYEAVKHCTVCMVAKTLLGIPELLPLEMLFPMLSASDVIGEHFFPPKKEKAREKISKTS